jgi:hypothetical protein
MVWPRTNFAAVKPERIELFLKNLASTIGLCVIEDADVVGTAMPVLVCIGVLWLIGAAVHEVILDPHVTTAAALDSLSINPDKWIYR